MTPERRAAETRRKSVERQRRREAGYKRVECWFDAETYEWLTALGIQRDVTTSALIVRLVQLLKDG